MLTPEVEKYVESLPAYSLLQLKELISDNQSVVDKDEISMLSTIYNMVSEDTNPIKLYAAREVMKKLKDKLNSEVIENTYRKLNELANEHLQVFNDLGYALLKEGTDTEALESKRKKIIDYMSRHLGKIRIKGKTLKQYLVEEVKGYITDAVNEGWLYMRDEGKALEEKYAPVYNFLKEKGVELHDDLKKSDYSRAPKKQEYSSIPSIPVPALAGR